MITDELEFQIEKTKDGYEILRINKDNKWIYIGSKYNMKSEIDKFLKKIDGNNDKDRIFLIYGFATGEHIKALRKNFKNNKILVFEPNRKLKDYINSIEWIIKDKDLKILCCEKDELINNMLNYIQEFELDYTNFLFFSNYSNLYIKEVKEFLEQLKFYFAELRITRNTKMFFSVRWFETLIRNIPYIVNGTPINLYENIYKNKPAIIVSAGPSLEKNIVQLKKLDNEMLIISGGRTLRSLIDKEIKPQLLAVADPGEISYELVKGYIEDLKIPLLFYEGTNENVVINHKGEKIFFSGNDFTDKIAGKSVVSLVAGGSVSHSMTRCAIFMGCNPIIFIGQDLAYTDDKKYSSISDDRDNKEKFNDLKRENDIFVEAVGGGKVRTGIDLNQFRISFEKIIKEFPDIKFINATEGGARINGTIEMPLNEVIEKYKGKKIEPIEKFEYSINMRKNATETLKEAKKAAQFIIKKSKRALRYLDELKTSYIVKNTSAVNSILRNLDKIDEEIKEKYIGFELIESLLYPIIYEILTAKSINIKKPNVDEMNLIVEQNKKLYDEFLKGLEYAITHIDETLLKLQENE
ncbi:motility associated factor glycosyltransferase family protein [Clostridium beijerinckii]|uniref:Motility associated factor glycosyltransferase family protein n=1 Tax=Clostridium beijerinckii TaxID=1520 RepID=A0AAX0B8D0_CLOBE|nr:6-hydroxymethylpterin diphosphokinase MptE-like protein [Clostridium beijerinckii]MBC2455905.1 motility associated factor glycosyltransferase family protein [Clostridium beijerinckii]MBC2474710.1 motility associated factor glycosyltransferase family protein [Clostridium beijerinckii]MDG5852872.1 DUF115 domain-containing protein [Clostridium beijerinckii]NOV61860.1 hypothetical protein [Clostridium beijerinckii]NOV68644.1 hypothetical protein [Clostridium beijerinckii]